MSKEVDALILIAHSNRIINDIPYYSFEDTDAGLYYIQEGRKTWYNGAPITEADRTNLFASDVLLRLGRLAASVLKSEPSNFIKDTNPNKLHAIHVMKELSPYENEDSLTLPIGLKLYEFARGEMGIPIMFEAAVMQKPSIFPELMAKWAISKQVHKERGTVELAGYRIEELLEGIDKVNIDEVAPTDITGSTYDVGDIIDHAGVESQLMNFPYYQTLNEKESGVEMLEAALEDLTKVAKAIK